MQPDACCGQMPRSDSSARCLDPPDPVRPRAAASGRYAAKMRGSPSANPSRSSSTRRSQLVQAATAGPGPRTGRRPARRRTPRPTGGRPGSGRRSRRARRGLVGEQARRPALRPAERVGHLRHGRRPAEALGQLGLDARGRTAAAPPGWSAGSSRRAAGPPRRRRRPGSRTARRWRTGSRGRGRTGSTAVIRPRQPSWNRSASGRPPRPANCRATIPTSRRLARMNRCRARSPWRSSSRSSASVASPTVRARLREPPGPARRPRSGVAG